jgi:hypothetical protein
VLSFLYEMRSRPYGADTDRYQAAWPR